MTDIARMRFQSASSPDEEGALVLDSGGTIHFEPSEAMLEKVAALEQKAVETSTRASAVAALVLIGLGLGVAALGWFVGRVAGRLREQLTDPRYVNDIHVRYDPQKGIRVGFAEGMARAVSFTWAPGEYNADEAEQFYEAYLRLRDSTQNE